jgi:hypothetical protein
LCNLFSQIRQPNVSPVAMNEILFSVLPRTPTLGA